MQIIANREINLSNYTPEDLEFSYPRGAQLSVEFGGLGNITIKGHNALSDTYYILPIIEKQTYDILTQIQSNGLYDVDISSVDKVQLEINGTEGTIYVKVIGG